MASEGSVIGMSAIHHRCHKKSLGRCVIVGLEELLFVDKGRNEKADEHKHHHRRHHLGIADAHNALRMDASPKMPGRVPFWQAGDGERPCPSCLRLRLCWTPSLSMFL